MLVFKSIVGVGGWLKHQPNEIAAAVSLRVALRVIPTLASGETFWTNGPSFERDVVQATFERASAAFSFLSRTSKGGLDVASYATARNAQPAWLKIYVEQSEIMFEVKDYDFVASAQAALACHLAADATFNSGVESLASATAAIDAALSAASHAHAAFRTLSSEAQSLLTGCAADGDFVETGLSAGDLLLRPLWMTAKPAWVDESWEKLKRYIRSQRMDLDAWIDWYDRLLIGASPQEFGELSEEESRFASNPAGDGVAEDGGAFAAPENEWLIEEDRAKRFGKTSEPATPKSLAEVASPQPRLTDDGRLDAGPNTTFDIPQLDADLSTLPIRQQRLIEALLAGLPGNAPKHLAGTLSHYSEELKVRGVQPILGILTDMADMIAASVISASAESDWLDAGERRGFDRFLGNHVDMVKHYPLDPQREDLYAQTPVDEVKASGPALEQPFMQAGEALREASAAHLTTPEMVLIIDKMIELARVISTQAPAAVAVEGERKVTAKRRLVLIGIGFFERAYNLAGSSVTIYGATGGADLLAALKRALEALIAFLPG